MRGAVERVYALPAHAATLDAGAMASATPEDHARYFTAFVSSLLSEFSRYLAGSGSTSPPTVSGTTNSCCT